MKICNLKNTENGIALLTAMLVIAMLMMLVLAFFSMMKVESEQAGNQEASIKALYAAESGIEWMLYALSQFYKTGSVSVTVKDTSGVHIRSWDPTSNSRVQLYFDGAEMTCDVWSDAWNVTKPSVTQGIVTIGAMGHYGGADRYVELQTKREGVADEIFHLQSGDIVLPKGLKVNGDIYTNGKVIFDKVDMSGYFPGGVDSIIVNGGVTAWDTVEVVPPPGFTGLGAGTVISTTLPSISLDFPAPKPPPRPDWDTTVIDSAKVGILDGTDGRYYFRGPTRITFMGDSIKIENDYYRGRPVNATCDTGRSAVRDYAIYNISNKDTILIFVNNTKEDINITNNSLSDSVESDDGDLWVPFEAQRDTFSYGDGDAYVRGVVGRNKNITVIAMSDIYIDSCIVYSNIATINNDLTICGLLAVDDIMTYPVPASVFPIGSDFIVHSAMRSHYGKIFFSSQYYGKDVYDKLELFGSVFRGASNPIIEQSLELSEWPWQKYKDVQLDYDRRLKGSVLPAFFGKGTNFVPNDSPDRWRDITNAW